MTQPVDDKCSDKDAGCLSNVQRIMRSVYALLFVASKPPKSPGLYLAYHMKRIFGTDQHLNKNSHHVQPNNLELEMDKFFTNALSKLSNETLKNVSILDMPGFGNSFNFFESNCYRFLLSNQFDMAIYRKLFNVNNKVSTKDLWKFVLTECNRLKNQWREYMSTTTDGNDFPKSLRNNTIFNFTNYIKEDMTTFLATYAASIPSVRWQGKVKKMFENVAKNVFFETNSEKHMKENGYRNNLIMDCVYKMPLLSQEPESMNGCMDFYPISTSNGLCYSFNGIESAQIWKNARIIQSFSDIFGRFQTASKKFGGSGKSKGN